MVKDGSMTKGVGNVNIIESVKNLSDHMQDEYKVLVASRNDSARNDSEDEGN